MGGVVERAAASIPLTGQELRVRDCLRDLGVDFESHSVFLLSERDRTVADFLVGGWVVLECTYTKSKARAKSWFIRNGTYMEWKFKQIKELQKKKGKQLKKQRQGVKGRCEGESHGKNNPEDGGGFLCVAFFEAPNYYKEKELPKILKSCMPHADAIFSSIKALKKYLREQTSLQKPVNRAIIAEKRLQSGGSEVVKLEHFLPKTYKKNYCKGGKWKN